MLCRDHRTGVQLTARGRSYFHLKDEDAEAGRLDLGHPSQQAREPDARRDPDS